MNAPIADVYTFAKLTDIETFLNSAKHLRALTLQLQQHRTRRRRIDAALARQVEEFTTLCRAMAERSPRVAELWTDALAELEQLTQDTSDPE